MDFSIETEHTRDYDGERPLVDQSLQAILNNCVAAGINLNNQQLNAENLSGFSARS
jgi:hypothetical protein